MNKRLRFLEIAPLSYKILGAKLLNLCREQHGHELNIKIIVTFSDQDTGRGNSILWLAKHFGVMPIVGVMPIEMAESDGGLDLHELTESALFSGITLIIQNIPLIESNTAELNNIPAKSESIIDLNTITNLKDRTYFLNGLSDSLVKDTTDKLLQQIEASNRFLNSNSKNILVGSLIYLTGLSILDEWSESKSFPSSRFIPWLLSTLNQSSPIWKLIMMANNYELVAYMLHGNSLNSREKSICME